MAHDVFISYSHKDKPTADAVCATLEARHIRCWIAPRDVIPGEDWGAAIIDAINGARVLVLVFSAHANESQQIKREAERAVSKGIPIIPLRIEQVAPERALEYFLSTPHWLDAYTPPLERHLQYLGEIVQQILAGKLAEPPRRVVREPAPASPRRHAALIGGALGVLVAVAVLGGWLLLGGGPAVGPGTAVAPTPAPPPTAAPVPSPPAPKPPSFAGKWQATKIEYDPSKLPEPFPVPDFLLAPFTGPNVSSTLEVSEAGHYSWTTSAEDHGTVTAAQANLTFTSAVTRKSMTRRASLSPTLSQAALAVVDGDKGDSELDLSTPTQFDEFVFAGKPSRGIIGQWHTPRVWIANKFWRMDLTIGADATYNFKLTNSESGVLQAADGKWTTTSGIGDGGNYRFDGDDHVTVAAGAGTMVFTRAQP